MFWGVNKPRQASSGKQLLAQRGESHGRNTHLRVGLNFEPAVAQMTLAPKGVDRGGVVVADFLLFGVITHPHPDVVIACSTVKNWNKREAQG